MMAVNTRGPFECVKAVLAVMRRQGYGKIINIASGTVFKRPPISVPMISAPNAFLNIGNSRRVGLVHSRVPRALWP